MFSFQAKPDPDFDISEVNMPPQNRVNLGFNFSRSRYLGNMSYSWVDEAEWRDVLDARFHGPTKAYSQVNGAFGVKWAADRLVTVAVVSFLVLVIGGAVAMQIAAGRGSAYAPPPLPQATVDPSSAEAIQRSSAWVIWCCAVWAERRARLFSPVV